MSIKISRIPYIIKSSWAQNEIGVSLGSPTEGSIEKCNQDVKQTTSRLVARVSMENIHRNALTRRSWAVDPLLHSAPFKHLIIGHQKGQPEESKEKLDLVCQVQLVHKYILKVKLTTHLLQIFVI